MLELAILGLLKEQELHGYELQKRLVQLLGPWSTVSWGSLYPALNRLEKQGAVKAVEARVAPAPAPAPAPMTGSLGGEIAAFRARRAATTSRRTPRTKKVYGITEHGESLFEELLAGAGAAPADDERAFSLRLSFARHLSAEGRMALLERRRAQLVEKLAKARTLFRTGTDRLDSYTRSIVEHGTETIERDISWLDRLIAAERASSVDVPSDRTVVSTSAPRTEGN